MREYFLVTIINGKIDTAQSDLDLLPSGLQIAAQGGISLALENNIHLEKPLQLVFLSTEENEYSFLNKIHLGTGSQLTLIEEYCSADVENYSSEIRTHVQVEDRATFRYYKIQNESRHASHDAHMLITQQQDSSVTAHVLSVGSETANETILVKLLMAGADCRLHGFYCGSRDHQQLSQQISIEHEAPHCTSEMVYKGILKKKSHGIFEGKVLVGEKAEKTSAHQANHTLLFDSFAKMETNPQFEIYADDVKCAHGATVGQLDSDLLFYLRSRGIGKVEALQLLAKAFSADVMGRIPTKFIANKMNEALEDYLC